MTANVIIIINFLAYVLLMLCLRKNKKSKISIFIATIWTITAASSVLFYYLNDGLFPWRRYENLSWKAFFYIFVCVSLCILPLAKINDHQKIVINGSVKLLTLFSWLIVILSFLPFCGNLIYTITHLGVSAKSFADNYGMEVEVLPGFLSSLNIVNKYFRTFVPILIFYNLQRYKPNKTLMIGLIIAFLNPVLGSLNGGSRFIFVADILYLLSIYVLFSNSLQENLKHSVRFYGFIALGIGGSIFLLISFFRIATAHSLTAYVDVLSSFSLYAGEGMLNFSQNMWVTTSHTDGYNTMTFMKYIWGESVTSVRNGELVSNMAGIPLYIFYTMVGDFYIDYGPYMTMVIFVGIYIFMNTLLRQKQSHFSFYKLVILGMILRAIVVGFTYFPYMNFSMELIYVPILTIILYFIDLTMKRRV